MLEERRRLEKERVLKERRDTEERDRKMNEKLQMIEQQRLEQSRFSEETNSALLWPYCRDHESHTRVAKKCDNNLPTLLVCFVTQKKTSGARRRNAQKGKIKMGGC